MRILCSVIFLLETFLEMIQWGPGNPHHPHLSPIIRWLCIPEVGCFLRTDVGLAPRGEGLSLWRRTSIVRKVENIVPMSHGNPKPLQPPPPRCKEQHTSLAAEASYCEGAAFHRRIQASHTDP